MSSRLNLVSTLHFIISFVLLLFLAPLALALLVVPNELKWFIGVALCLVALCSALFYLSSSFILKRIHPTFSAALCILIATGFPVGTIVGLLALQALLSAQRLYRP